MTTPEEPLPPGVTQADELLASPELAKAVESEQYQRFLDHIPIGIAVARGDGDATHIVYANPAFHTIVGETRVDVPVKDWSVLNGFVHEDDGGVSLVRAVSEGEDFLGAFRKEAIGGGAVLLQAYVSRIENEDGSENYRIVALVDVTEHERAQRDAFEQEIRGKDMLLKELQHRVKNNLQLITALIRLEARNAKRGDPVNLDRLAGRIEALALLYQALSTDRFAQDIDLGSYLGEIATAAMRTYTLSKLHLELKVGYAPVSVNVAMPVGLLVNELITNAFKYAFPTLQDGTISIACTREADDRYRVVVGDDGVGIPADIEWPQRGKLGALILQTLRENTRDAEFKVETAPGQGTRAVIEFLVKPAARKPN
jgi:PAS domain S-box-containing protein